MTVQTSQVGHVPWLKIGAMNGDRFLETSSVRAVAVRTLSRGTSHRSRAGQHHASPFGQGVTHRRTRTHDVTDKDVNVANSRFATSGSQPSGALPTVLLPLPLRRSATRASGRVDEVLEVVKFVGWCGPVEPFPDLDRFGEPRGGGGPVTCGERKAGEPFEGGRGDGRFAEPAAELERFLVPGSGCGGVAVGFVAPPEPSERGPFPDGCAEVDEPVHRARVVARCFVPGPVDVGEEAVPVSGEYLPGTVTDFAGGGCCFVEQPSCGVVVTHVHLLDRQVGDRPLGGVPQPGATCDVDRLLQGAGSVFEPAELP